MILKQKLIIFLVIVFLFSSFSIEASKITKWVKAGKYEKAEKYCEKKKNDLFYQELALAYLNLEMVERGNSAYKKIKKYIIRVPVILKLTGTLDISAAVDKLTDQKILTYIAKYDEDSDVRGAAVKKLKDQVILARVAKNDTQWHVRVAAVEKLEEQELLADIAKNDEDSDVRKAAVWKLKDQKLLADIAKNSKDKNVRRAAVKNLTDQKILADIAINDEDSDIRKAAVWKLKDQKLLADIAKNSKDKNVRRAAVKNLTDQKILADIAINDEDEDICWAAVKNLTDQKILADIVRSDKYLDVRLIRKFIAAFDSVPTNSRVYLMREVLPSIRVLSCAGVASAFGDIVSIKTEWSRTSAQYTGGTKYGSSFTCSIKVQKLSEPLSYTWSTYFQPFTSSLEFRSANVYGSDLYGTIFDKLPNQKILANIARNVKDKDVREAASMRLPYSHQLRKIVLASVKKVKILTDMTLLADIARIAADWEVRRAAVDRLTDQKILTEIARSDEYLEVRRAAVKRLTSQKILTEIAWNDEYGDVREAASKRLPYSHQLHKIVLASERKVKILTDMTLLIKIARIAADWKVRRVAVKRLTDQKILADIARNDEAGYVGSAAVERLIDQKILADIARNHKYWSVRETAVERLNDQKILTYIAKYDEDENVRRAAKNRLR